LAGDHAGDAEQDGEGVRGTYLFQHFLIIPYIFNILAKKKAVSEGQGQKS
jgi:hypothetical protein